MKITDAPLDHVVACKLHPLSEKIDPNMKEVSMRHTSRALIPWGCALSRLRFAERPYSGEPQTVGAVYDLGCALPRLRFADRPGFFVQSAALLAFLLFLSASCSSTSQKGTAAKPFNIIETTIEQIHAAYKSGQLTARQLVQMYLDRIEAYEVGSVPFSFWVCGTVYKGIFR